MKINTVWRPRLRFGAATTLTAVGPYGERFCCADPECGTARAIQARKIATTGKMSEPADCELLHDLSSRVRTNEGSVRGIIRSGKSDRPTQLALIRKPATSGRRLGGAVKGGAFETPTSGAGWCDPNRPGLDRHEPYRLRHPGLSAAFGALSVRACDVQNAPIRAVIGVRAGVGLPAFVRCAKRARRLGTNPHILRCRPSHSEALSRRSFGPWRVFEPGE